MATAATDNENLTLARQLFEWFKDGQMDPFMQVLHPSVRARMSVGDTRELVGREEVIRWWQELAAADGDVEARPLDFELAENCVIVRGYLWQREGRALAERQAFWLYEIEDGMVTRMESHPTRRAALAACAA